MVYEYNTEVLMKDITTISTIPLRWGYKKGHIEKGFQSEVTKFLRSQWWYAHHIEDVWFSTRLLDLYCLSPNGLQMLIELKKTSWFTFNLSQFEPSQVELMIRLEKHNVPYKVLIYSQRTNTYKVTTYWELLSLSNDKNGIKLF